MDSKLMYKILSNDRKVQELNFLGVFPLDLIPTSALNHPCCLVINTKPSNHPGEHWVCVVKTENNTGIYFDSFGFPPYNLPEIGLILDDCTEWIFNDIRLQSTFSTVCGQYCIFFLTHFARGLTMEHIIYLINDSGDTNANDALIFNYIKHKYPLRELNNLPVIDFPFIFNQISQSLS